MDIEKLKIKRKKLYALLYLPTGEYITWSNNTNDIYISRTYTIDDFIEMVNKINLKILSNSPVYQYNKPDYDFITRNKIIFPTLSQHYEKIELNIDKAH